MQNLSEGEESGDVIDEHDNHIQIRQSIDAFSSGKRSYHTNTSVNVIG